MKIRSDDPRVIDFADRVFHLEVLKGGMNRLLFRSNRTSVSTSRIEILFMNVQYAALGTSLDGLVVQDVGPAQEWDDQIWRIVQRAQTRVFKVTSASGEGHVVAGSVAVDVSDAGPSDPSRFFMMDRVERGAPGSQPSPESLPFLAGRQW